MNRCAPRSEACSDRWGSGPNCLATEKFLGSPKLREFSCLILDVQMPGMDGLELQLRLAAASHPIPIIFVTAYGDEKARERALRGGAVSFLAKPFSEDALLEAVQSAIDVETEN